jgi:hypothetical protein
VVGYAALRLSPAAVTAWRGQLSARTGGRLTASFVKNSDEQTVAALAAVLQSADDYGLNPEEMKDWGVFSAPRYFGRVALAQTMVRFAAEGAWGLSPHMIPHRSLHAVSGTISQALNFRGLNLGVGGGCHAASEALLLAAATLADGRVPGLWVTMTGFDPEVVPTESGQAAASCDCCAVALALVAARPGVTGWRLGVSAGTAHVGPGQQSGGPKVLSVERLMDVLTGESPIAGATFSLGAGGRLNLDGTRAKAGAVC